MEFKCFLCGDGGHFQRSEDEWHCLACGAQHNWDEGFVLSSKWAKAEIKRLQTTVMLAYAALRAVIPDRKKGCLCDNCLRTIAAEEGGGDA